LRRGSTYYEKIKREREEYVKLRRELELYRSGAIMKLIREYYESLKPRR